jgi:large subunit ribosomal protein L32e
MNDNIKRLFKVRKVQKAKKPSFRRADGHKYKRLDTNWRRPRGLQGKMRRGIKCKGAVVQAGYGSPAAVKGLHPSGFYDVLVNTVTDLDNINAATEAVRISAKVGGRKKAMMEAKASELGLKVLNPTRSD